MGRKTVYNNNLTKDWEQVSGRNRALVEDFIKYLKLFFIYSLIGNSFLTFIVWINITENSAITVVMQAPTEVNLGIINILNIKFTIAPTITDPMYSLSFSFGIKYCVLITFDHDVKIIVNDNMAISVPVL